MQVVLYTEKTVAQSLTALNARMQAKATSTRPSLDGWVEKSGRFSVGVTSGVFGRFTRTTFLHGKLERQGTATVIKGNVSRGATKENKIIIYASLAVLALALAGGGNLWMAAVLVPVAGALYIPLTGGTEWRMGGGAWRQRAAGEVIHHASNVSHAMRTGAEPLLAFYLWRGGPLAARSTITGAAGQG